MPLVDLERAHAHLRTGGVGSSDDQELSLKIAEAEAIIRDYLKVEDESPQWEPEAVDAPVVTAAVLIILSALWDDREGTGVGDYLKPDGTVARLLMRMRDPALA